MADGGITEALLVTSLVTTAVGAGVSYYGQQQQAKQQSQMADYNYSIAAQNQQVQDAMARRQLDIQNQQVGIQNQQVAYQSQVDAYQKQVAESQAQAQENNATAMQNYARAQEQQGVDQASRIRMEKDRAIAVQRGQYAASGVTEEGSPLAVLADTASNYELQVHDTMTQADLQAKKSDQQAAMMRFDAGVQRSNAALGSDAAAYQSGLITYKNQMDAYGNELNFEASQAGSRISMRQADLTRLSGKNTAAGTSLASYGTLLTGASTMAATGTQYAYPLRKGGTGAGV